VAWLGWARLGKARQGEDLMTKDVKLTEIAAEIRHETTKAYLLFDGIREAWVPKSQVENNEDGTFTMPTWLAERAEFI
jgi:hypothetical protein